MSKIIAIIGMPGCGKTEVVNHFASKGGYGRVSFSDVVLNYTKEWYGEINEKNEKKTRERLREEYGMAAMATLSIEKIKELSLQGNVVIESLYSWEEYKVLRELFHDIKLLCVFAPKEMRYERLGKRSVRPLTKEEVTTREIIEIEKLNKGGPIAFTDYLLVNTGSLEELKKETEQYF